MCSAVGNGMSEPSGENSYEQATQRLSDGYERFLRWFLVYTYSSG